MRVVVLMATDLIGFTIARIMLQALRDGGVLGPVVADMLAWTAPPGSFEDLQFAAALLLGLAVAGAYRPGDCRRDWRRILAGVALAGGLMLWSELWVRDARRVLVHYAVTVAGVTLILVFLRLLVDRLVARLMVVLRRPETVLFVGDPTDYMSVRTAGGLSRAENMRSVGWVTVSRPKGLLRRKDSLGPVEDFWGILHATQVDTVVLCGALESSAFDLIVEATAAAGCRLLAVSRYEGVGRLAPSLVWYRRLPFVELTVPAIRGRDQLIKRVVDLVASGFGLVVLSPLFGLIAAAIKLDSSGPVFFSQDRVGMAGRIFRLLKFRTMRNGADEEKERVAHLNHSGDPRLFKIRQDPRVTRVGRLLRKWSLDELPQLWNVFRGEMSLVGPRPFFESDLAEYAEHHFGRLGAKPGITGLWQVSGRSSVLDFEEVVKLDCEYIERWSLWLDFKILLRTFPAVVRRTGAY